MANKIVAKVRRTSLASTYGVGALLPTADDSVMIRGLQDWFQGDEIQEPRLARSLGVTVFRSPPTWRDSGDVPAIRFPEYVFCTKCRKLGRWYEVIDQVTEKCKTCHEIVSPSRFVCCCTNGHIEDFPYSSWVHEDARYQGEGHNLRLVARGHTSALSDLVVECSCGKKRSMDGAFLFNALRGLHACRGSRPWLSEDDASCDQPLRTLQRGSSNVWFAVTSSAISIPSVPNIADTFIAGKAADLNLEMPAADLARMLRAPAGCTTDDLQRAIERVQNPALSGPIPSDRELRAEEYTALVQSATIEGSEAHFLCEEVDLTDSGLTELVAQVSRVSRLREVRALTGFTRVLPKTEESEVAVAPLSDTRLPWLPAIEVLGEGVFVRLDEDRLEHWETGEFAVERLRLLTESRSAIGGSTFASDLEVSARSLALHTLAHILVDEMSLTSGYPTASLRERVYDDQGQAGILIYTATADSAGSLGGLAALSDKHRFAQTLVNGLERATWCTTDPVCIETTSSGVNGMNLAACHACCLVPETSCERFNLTLDRASIVGQPGHDAGLFRKRDRTLTG